MLHQDRLGAHRRCPVVTPPCPDKPCVFAAPDDGAAAQSLSPVSGYGSARGALASDPSATHGRGRRAQAHLEANSHHDQRLIPRARPLGLYFFILSFFFCPLFALPLVYVDRFGHCLLVRKYNLLVHCTPDLLLAASFFVGLVVRQRHDRAQVPLIRLFSSPTNARDRGDGQSGSRFEFVARFKPGGSFF